MRFLLAAVVVTSALLRAAEPARADRLAVQETLRRYLVAVNACDLAAAKAVLAADFINQFVYTTADISARFRIGDPTACAPGKPPLWQFTAQARFLRSVTSDVISADAYFRTVDLPGGDQAGRAAIIFVHREGAWRLFSLRFIPFQFRKPQYPIQPATEHDSPAADGWITLFDGASLNAFHDITGAPPPSTWTIENGALKAIAGPATRSMRTRDTYRSFELRFEWKTPPKGNSGVKYRLFYMMETQQGGTNAAGYEYQLADDNGDPGAIEFPVERTGSLYNQFAPQGATPKPLGEYNQSAIIVRGSHCEHWLNGVKVLEFESDSNPPDSPILLQHHGTDMWFRNIRIRRLDP